MIATSYQQRSSNQQFVNKNFLIFGKLALSLKILNLFSTKWNVTLIFVC